MQLDTINGAEGVRLPRERHGNGDAALLLVHGWSCHRGFWHEQAARLGSDYLVVSPELGGHGESRGTRSRWDIASFAEDVAAAVGDIDLPVVIAGHSMGGAVALRAAGKIGDRVRGVILGDTFAFDWGHIPEEGKAGFLNAIRTDFPTMISTLVDSTTPDDIDPALRDWIKAEMAGTDPAIAEPAFASLLDFDGDGALAALPADLPVHAINCPQAHPAPRERFGARIVETVLEDTGHFHLLEAPDRFEAALRDSVDRCLSA